MIYTKCVFVALVIQHAKHMRHIIMSSVPCLALLRLFTLSHRRHEFRGIKSLNIKCVLLFPTSVSKTFLIPSRSQCDTVINVHTHVCNVPLILVRL